MFVTVQHKHSNRPFDSMNIWLEEVKADGFVVCLREFMSFDGIHTGLKVVSFKKLAQSSTITFFFVLICYQLNLKLNLIVWKLIKTWWLVWPPLINYVKIILEELLFYLTHKCFKTVKLWICFAKTAWRKGWRGGLEVKNGGRGALIRKRGSVKERLFSLKKISPLLRMCSRCFEKKESFL